MTSPLFQQFLSFISEGYGNQPQQNLDIDLYQELADLLLQTAEYNMKYTSNRYDQLMAMFYQLLQSYQNQGATLKDCSNIFETFVLVIQMHVSIVRKNPGRMLSTIQKLFQMFNMVDITADPEWCLPPQGYDDDQNYSDQNNLTKQIMSYFDRIASAYEYSKFLQFFNSALPGWFHNSDDWKQKYTLFMVMSQLGENISQSNMVHTLVQYGINSSSHPHPKVRYGVLHMFGQLSDDMKPDFQLQYSNTLLPLIISMTQDSIPRVQAHAMACLTNFLQDWSSQNVSILQPYIDQIISLACSFFDGGCSGLKENSISTLASLSTVNILQTNQIELILNQIDSILTNDMHKHAHYNQLIGQTLQCLSLIIYGQSEDKVKQYLPLTVQLLISLEGRVGRAYFISAWSRLCLKYNDFTELQHIFPKILNAVSAMIDIGEQDLDSCLTAIDNTIDSFKIKITPYAQSIIQLCKNGVDKLGKQTRQAQTLFSILNNLVVSLKSEAPDPQWQIMSQSLFSFFYQQIEKILQENQQTSQQTFKSLQTALKGLQQIIEHLHNLFNGSTIEVFLQKIMQITSKINQQIHVHRQNIYILKSQYGQITDQIEQQQNQSEKTLEETCLTSLLDCRLVVPDIISSIVNVADKVLKIKITQSIYPHIEPYLDSNGLDQDIRYALYYLCNFQDQLGYQGIQNVQQIYEQKFSQFSLKASLQVRNSAVYGFGVFMQIKPVNKTNDQIIIKWLNILWDSLLLSSQDKLKKKQFNFARDNIVSALGKLIASKSSVYSHILNGGVYSKWLQNLPLNNDKDEGDIQQSILLKILNQNPQLLINNKQDVLQILTIFGKYIAKRMNKKKKLQIQRNINDTRQFMVKIQSWQIFTQNSGYLWQNLSNNCQLTLNNLMESK